MNGLRRVEELVGGLVGGYQKSSHEPLSSLRLGNLDAQRMPGQLHASAMP